MGIGPIGPGGNHYLRNKQKHSLTNEQTAKLQAILKAELKKDYTTSDPEFFQLAILAGQHKAMLDENDREILRLFIERARQQKLIKE